MMSATNNSDRDKKSYPYDFVAYHFLDAYGKMLGMQEDGDKTDSFLRNGLHIDGSSIPGMANVERSDLKVIPEEDTFLSINIDNPKFVHHRFWCHLLDADGRPHPCDPRGILQRQIDKAHGMGFEPYMFSEIEFYLVDKETGEPADTATYCSLPPKDSSYEYRQQLGKLCKDCGVRVKRIHHECGPGQNEMELDLAPSMKNADDTVLSMWLMDILASANNQTVLFNPKPFPGEAGNGLHHHIMLRDLATGENLCQAAGVSSKSELSAICRHGIAGLLKYADEITAVFAASDETFERLQPGFEAPIYKAWGYSNRTALVRVPQTSADGTRFEYRGGDLSSGNVHLFGAVLLAAVLRGIEDKLEAPKPYECNVEELSDDERREQGLTAVPLTFPECIKVLETSDFLREALGEDMIQLLIRRDQQELNKSQGGDGILVLREQNELSKLMGSTINGVVETAKHMLFHQ